MPYPIGMVALSLGLKMTASVACPETEMAMQTPPEVCLTL